MNNTPGQPAGSFDPNQYDFIMNHQQPKKTLIPRGGGHSSRSWILIMVIAGLTLLLVLILVLSTIFGGDSSKDALLGIARQQSEIIRIAQIGVDKGRSSETLSLAFSTKLSVTTDQQNIQEYLGRNGDEFSGKDLVVGQDKTIDEKLSEAEQNGTFDTAFNTVIRELLGEYQKDLKSAHDSLSGQIGKQVLAANYQNATLLLEDAEK